MDRRQPSLVTLLNAFRAMLVVCLVWFAPLQAFAQSGHTADVAQTTAAQAHCPTDMTAKMVHHDGMAHQMSCCLVCAGTTDLGHFALPVRPIRAERVIWPVRGLILLPLAMPDAALRPPNTAPIA